jgi:phosphodiesterase/alkaline phosphatase D-like protein
MTTDDAFPDGLLDDSVEIGAVNHRSVRVWIRKPDRIWIAGTLSIEGSVIARAETALSEETDWTGVLTFELPVPRPGASFQIDVEGARRDARFAPEPGSTTGLTFGFGSCNRPFTLNNGEVDYHQAAGIYDALGRDLERAGASFLLLGGDQIYSDELEPISVRGVARGDHSEPPALDEAIASYRRISRGYLNVPGFLTLRQRFPTVAIWDDHDIFDNWGSRKTVSDLDLRMFEAATKVYADYQHARNPGRRALRPPFHYDFSYGNIGFLVLDIRGKRDWSSGHLLGEQQWQACMDYLDDAANSPMQTLFVVTSVPVAHVSRWLPLVAEPIPGKMGDSVRDRWTARAFRPQRDALLEKLLEWENAAPRRQVILLSGDVHVAAAYTIRPRSGPGKIEQFTSSAFTTPLTSFERYLNLIAARGSNLFEPDWSFTRHFMSYANNAGLVRLTPLEGGGHHVELLIRGWNWRDSELQTARRYAAIPDDATGVLPDSAFQLS